MRPEIITWLKTVRLRDYPMDQARERLLEKGFDAAEVDAAINHITQEFAVQKPNRKPIYFFFAALAVVVILVLIITSL